VIVTHADNNSPDKPGYENGGRWWRWFEAIKSIYDSGLAASIPASATSILVELATHADPDSWRAWPGLTELGKRAGLSRQQAKAAVRLLVKAGAVEVESVGCGTIPSTYKLNLPVGGRGDISSRLTYQPGLRLTPGRDDISSRGGVIYQPQTNTNNSYQELLPKSARKHRADADAEAIRQAYPRKVGGKAVALKAIHKALAEVAKREADAAGWLLERVQAFAQSPAGQRGEYTPYPATWFNRQQYDDDPAEWARLDEVRGNSKARPRPKAITNEELEAMKAMEQ
jgi:hypothetical protein